MSNIKLKELLGESNKKSLNEVMASFKELEGLTVKNTRIIKKKGGYSNSVVIITFENGIKLEFENTGLVSIFK